MSSNTIYTVHRGRITEHKVIREVPTGWRVETSWGSTIVKRCAPSNTYYDINLAYPVLSIPEALALAERFRDIIECWSRDSFSDDMKYRDKAGMA